MASQESTNSTSRATSRQLPDNDFILLHNELNYFAQNQLDAGVPATDLAAVLHDFYTDNQCESAKAMLIDLIPDDVSERPDFVKNRIGPTKRSAIVMDIIKLLQYGPVVDAQPAPRFVAAYSQQVPPMSLKSVDITVILKLLQTVQQDLSDMKQKVVSKEELDSILKSYNINTQVRQEQTQQKMSYAAAVNNNGEIHVVEHPKHSHLVNQKHISETVYNDNNKVSHSKSNDGFTVVHRQKRQRQLRSKTNIVTGTASSSSSLIKASQPVRRVFVTRLDPGTQIMDIENLVHSNSDYEVSVEKLKTKYNSYSSFVITCHGNEERDFIMRPDIWPIGTLIKPFYTAIPRNRNSNGQDKIPDKPQTAVHAPSMLSAPIVHRQGSWASLNSAADSELNSDNHGSQSNIHNKSEDSEL